MDNRIPPKPDGIQIKRLRSSDSGILFQIATDVFDGAVDPVRLADFLTSPGHILILAIAGTIVVGQLRAVRIVQPDRAPDLYIDNLGVTPTHKRQGIARAMFAELRDQPEVRGCRELWVATEVDNPEALAFYRSMGLKDDGMRYFEGSVE